MIWTNEQDKLFLAAAGLEELEKFWNIEVSGADVEYKHLNVEKDKNGHVHKQTSCIRVRGARYYLKKASGRHSKHMHNEFKSLKKMSDIGLSTQRLAAHFIDETAGRILLLYKNLTGYHSLTKLIDGTASPDALADFQTREKSIIKELLDLRHSIICSGHIYQAWEHGHIFVRYRNPGIVIVDLEHLLTVKELPFIRRNPVSLLFLKWHEWRKFKSSLRSKVYTDRLLKDIFKGKI